VASTNTIEPNTICGQDRYCRISGEENTEESIEIHVDSTTTVESIDVQFTGQIQKGL
jgi:hypothetical protein